MSEVTAQDIRAMWESLYRGPGEQKVLVPWYVAAYLWLLRRCPFWLIRSLGALIWTRIRPK